MNDNDTSQIDHVCIPAPKSNWNAIELSDLFVGDPPKQAHVELVDDPEATVYVVVHDLLTELLCEV